MTVNAADMLDRGCALDQLIRKALMIPPYVIRKQLVWEAYQRVKANQGAAGVDGESLSMFDKT